MAVETDVLDELRLLRTRVPGLAGSLAATVDGLVLAHDVPCTEPEGLAALTAAALGVAHRMTDAAYRGSFRELLVRGAHGYIATYAAWHHRRAHPPRRRPGQRRPSSTWRWRGGARIAELVDARIGPGGGRHADRPATREEAQDPADRSRPIGTLPVRTPQRPAHRPGG